MTALTRIDRSWAPDDTEPPKPIRFCSRCGHPADEPPGRFERQQRVCERCSMGVLLSCARDALPGTSAAFLICTHDLAITAVSEAGEKIFGKEEAVLGSSVLDLVSSPVGDDQIARHAGLAAQRACDPIVMPLRLLSRKAASMGTLAARIATCEPPRAALITVEQSGFGRR